MPQKKNVNAIKKKKRSKNLADSFLEKKKKETYNHSNKYLIKTLFYKKIPYQVDRMLNKILPY